MKAYKTALGVVALVCLLQNSAHADDFSTLNSTPPTPEKAALSDLLTTFTIGNNALYNRIISPGKSLNTGRSDADRTAELNAQLLTEMNAVIFTFKNSTEEEKVQKVNQVVAQIDREVVSNKGVHIQFIGGRPSAAINRTLVMIPKDTNNPALTVENVLNTVTSYRRSARPSDYAYEYSQADNLQQSTVRLTQGNDETWKPPLAPAGLEIGKDYAIKKCRQIFGWKCATALYHADRLLSGEDEVGLMYTGSYNLKDNADNSQFARDGRSKNQVEGSTGLVIVKESPNWIMVYAADAQWKNGGISFGGIIQGEAKKDFKRYKERLATDLRLNAAFSADN